MNHTNYNDRHKSFEDDLTIPHIPDDVTYFVDLDQQEAIRMHFSPHDRSRTSSRRTSTVYSKSRRESTCSVISNLGGEVFMFRDQSDLSGSIEIRDYPMNCIEGDEGSPSALSIAEEERDDNHDEECLDGNDTIAMLEDRGL